MKAKGGSSAILILEAKVRMLRNSLENLVEQIKAKETNVATSFWKACINCHKPFATDKVSHEPKFPGFCPLCDSKQLLKEIPR